jgi:hypothetical protein
MKLRSWVSMVGIAVGSVIASGNFDRAGAVTTVLYDSASGTTPNAVTSPYFSFNNPDTGSSQAFISAAEGTRLNTFNPTTAPFPPTAEFSRAGYSNYNSSGSFVNSAFPILDKNAGYTLSFTVKINSQTNNGTNGANRAGFSALILGDDNTGIEIGFRNPNTQGGGTTPDIFSQSGSSFTVGERNDNLNGILSQLTTYDLSVLGGNYTLKNGNTTLLTGALRNYAAAAVPNTATAVYALSNFLFLGDNTTSAGANVDISNITLTTNSSTAVPEPSNLLGIGMAIGLGVKLKRKLQKINNR